MCYRSAAEAQVAHKEPEMATKELDITTTDLFRSAAGVRITTKEPEIAAKDHEITI